MRSTGPFPMILAYALAAVVSPTALRAEMAGVAVAAATAPAPAPALAPRAAAFRTALLAAAADLGADEQADIIAFYEARGFTPYWTDEASGRDAQLLAALEGAAAHGLPPRRYDPAGLHAALDAAAADQAAQGEAELAATRAYLRYGRDLHSGLLSPARVDEEINVLPPRPQPAALLARLDAEGPAKALAGLAPASPEYAALLAEKSRLEGAAAEDWGPDVPEGATLRRGDAGLRVAALRGRLALRGFPAPAPADPASFDEGLETALEKFQASIGLESDGLAGKRSIAAVNEGPEARLRQVIVNLERLRWTNRDPGDRYIVANIPDYSVRMIENGATVFQARTVVGKPEDTRTPEFSDRMTYLVVNPTWHIPDSIAQRVYLPKLKANPNTLANSNMRIFTRAGTEINPGLVDFNQFSQGNFPFRIKQNPSTANALGRVKFMFPNQFSIYLHDTPSRELFAKSERAFSNGCVRVENPLDLAYLLLAGQVEDPEASFDAWLAAKSERTVNLDRPIPVHLVYRTVFLDDAGAIQYRFDIYGRDAEVFEALAGVGVTLPAAQG